MLTPSRFLSSSPLSLNKPLRWKASPYPTQAQSCLFTLHELLSFWQESRHNKCFPFTSARFDFLKIRKCSVWHFEVRGSTSGATNHVFPKNICLSSREKCFCDRRLNMNLTCFSPLVCSVSVSVCSIDKALEVSLSLSHVTVFGSNPVCFGCEQWQTFKKVTWGCQSGLGTVLFIVPTPCCVIISLFASFQSLYLQKSEGN